MSGTTDWLSAAGGIVGAIGGPAGIWAAWNQHRENHRRRYGPPEELVGLLAKIIDVSHDVKAGYRDEAWFQAAGVYETEERLDELIHLVRDDLLKISLRLTSAACHGMSHSVIQPTDSNEQQISRVGRQASSATDLEVRASGTLEVLRRLL
ncbi:hypothetical protein ACGFY3_30850 [Streptomyces mirabilis]|uniref:hypothetical protein n=1 Tax=Streptomyces mirabilis TaxID=68239 RepID=UPI003718558F